MSKRREKNPVSVSFVALGCPKNMVDSEVMLAQIGQGGYILSPDPDNADIVIINTCGFIEPAKAEAIEAINQAVAQKKQGAVRKVIVTGCLSERMGQSLADEVDGIDAIVGLDERDQIAQIIADCLANKRSKPTQHRPASSVNIHDDRGRLLITPGHWAYLRISEGCDRKCAFCTIPSIRGKFRSKPMEIILDEARELVDNGAVELSIIAQDSNYYGRDMGIKNGLVQLIDELEKIDGLAWIRLMYLYPAGVDDELIGRIAQSDKVVPYVDIPIQHISNPILKAMRRADTKEHTTELIAKLRQAMPDVVLRTTLIAGFPGETEVHFEELLEFIRQTKFDALGCFPFYAEPGTVAAELDGQVPTDIRQERTNKIMETQQAIIFDKMDSQVGRKVDVLVDEVYEKATIGRYYGQAPHIDSVCVLPDYDGQVGTFVKAKITGRDEYDFVLDVIE